MEDEDKKIAVNKYGEEIKKIVFKDTAKNHANLKIKLDYDKLSQVKFFHLCISAYLNDDQNMRALIDSVKPNKSQVKINQKSLNEADKLKKKFAFADDEIENIFDLIEMEHPNL